MHYENEESGKIRKLMEKAAAEQNFRYDKGEIAFAVIVYHGKVIVNFGKPIASLDMSPDEARQLALSLRQHANQAERDSGL